MASNLKAMAFNLLFVLLVSHVILTQAGVWQIAFKSVRNSISVCIGVSVRTRL